MQFLLSVAHYPYPHDH